MNEAEEHEVFDNYNRLLMDLEHEKADENDCYLSVIKKHLTKYRYNKLLEYLEESGGCSIEGIVRKRKVFGEYQTEPYWFKGVYVDQSCGYTGDDFSGYIFVPITDKHFLKFYFEC